MFGVLIVDDEMIIRYGIKSMIDWEKLGLVVVGDAANGKEALELFNEQKPEIVIADIKMPVMDGIELIRQIRQKNSETKIIILSCLQDFEYAREAIRMGASEYLVKSDMMPSDMENVLRKVKETIRIEHDKLQQINDFRQKAQKNQSLEKERFLRDASMGAIPQNETSQEAIERLGLGYLQGDLFILCVGIDYYEKLISGLSEKEKREIDTLLAEFGKKALDGSERVMGEVFAGNHGEINFIIKISGNLRGKAAYDSIHQLGEALIRGIQNETGYIISVGISDSFNEILKMKDAYFQAQSAYKFKTFFGCGRVIHFMETLSSKPRERKLHLDIRTLQDYIYGMKREQVNHFVDDVFNNLADSKDFEGVNFASLEIVLTLSSVYSHISRNDEEIMDKKREYYEQIKYLETVNDLKNWFKASFSQLMDLVGSAYHDDKNVISKALNYIQANYSRNISLQTISDHVHLSKNYFVNLFKREVGESFVEHLTRVRVENAKRLLKDQRLKAIDVGNMVGFEDQRYFSKVFKKMTGFTPTEYKELKL